TVLARTTEGLSGKLGVTMPIVLTCGPADRSYGISGAAQAASRRLSAATMAALRPAPMTSSPCRGNVSLLICGPNVPLVPNYHFGGVGFNRSRQARIIRGSGLGRRRPGVAGEFEVVEARLQHAHDLLRQQIARHLGFRGAEHRVARQMRQII